MTAKEKVTISEREVPVVADLDVLVVGGGPAGIAAAVAAARHGADTMLVERYSYLGGLATGQIVVWLHPMDDGKEITVAGIVSELMERLEFLGGLVRPARDEVFKASWELERKYFKWPFLDSFIRSDPRQVGYKAMMDIETGKYAFFQMVEEAGVKLRLQSWFVMPLATGNEVWGAVLLSKSGLQAVKAKVVVDASGDGDVFAGSGAEFVHCSYVMTVSHYMGNVDTHRAAQFCLEHPEEAKNLDAEVMRLFDWPTSPEVRPFTNWGWWSMSPNEGVVWCVCPHMVGLDGTNVEDLTRLEVEGRKRIWKALEFVRKHYPGFENAYIARTGDQSGVRQSRLLLGEHVLTLEELMEGQRLPDSVGRGRYCCLPYRCLVPKKVENLLVAGRCCSMEPEAQKLFRAWPECMVGGQAAGTAAALAVEGGVKVRNVDVPTLQRRLKEQGVILGADGDTT